MVVCRLFCVVFLCLVLLPFINAAIYFNDDSLGNFNVGDELMVSFRVEENLPKMDYVEVSFVCDGEDNVIFKEYKSFLNKDSYEFNVSSLADVTGDCFVEVSFEDEVARTSDFEVSSKLGASVFYNSRVFMPGDMVVINGSVSKFNSHDFNYSVRVSVDDFFDHTWGFRGQDFLLNFSLPSDIPSGEYDVMLYFEERNLFGDVINSRDFVDNMSVLSRPASILLGCDEQFKPPYNLSINVSLLDQSNSLVRNESVVLKVFDLDNNLFYDGVVNSGGDVSVSFPSNSSIGGWRISAFYAGITAVKPLYVLENRQVSVDFVNGTSYLSVSNIGNLPYEGVLQVSLRNESGEFNLPINVELDMGESYNYDLGYVGGYNLSVDGREFSNVYITGAVISGGKMVSYLFVGLIVVGLIFLIVLFLFFRYKAHDSKDVVESPSKILVSGNKNVKFVYPRSSSVDSSSEASKKVYVNEDSPAQKIFKEGYQKSFDVDISRYSSSSGELNSSNKDIPFVKNALKEVSNKGVGTSNDKTSYNARPSKKPERMVYCLFYRKGDSENLSEILKKYGLSIYRIGDMRFSLLKSSRSPERMLINLSKLIINETDNNDIVLHSMKFNESSGLSRIFPYIRDILKEGEGLLITGSIFSRLSSRNDFVFFRNLRLKESIIKLYRLISV